MLHFDSDYMEGALPEIMRRLIDTNLDQTVGYGCDQHCAHAREMIVKACGLAGADVHFLVGGTHTNSTVVDCLLRSYQGVLAAVTSHINAHEAGTIEAAGHKVLTLPEHDGKIDARDIHGYVTGFFADESHQHMVEPGMVYITHPTEYGTLYTLDELEAISATCREHGLPLYLDGARLGYGLAAEGTDVTLRDIARLCDVFYIGGTKVGALFGEAVVSRPGLMRGFFAMMKQHGALLAKGRLLGLQFETLFSDGLYARAGRHAVELAQKLKRAFVAKGYKLLLDSPTNQQFVVMPNDTIDRLARYATFELWEPRGQKQTTVRFVTSWATRDEAVDALIALL